MKIYSYSGQAKGNAVANVTEAELKALSGTFLSDLGRKLVSGDRADLEVGIGQDFVDLVHEVEHSIQLAEGGRVLTMEKTNEVIVNVCKKVVENQELALVFAEVIIEGFGIGEVRFRVEDVNSYTFGFFGQYGNSVAC